MDRSIATSAAPATGQLPDFLLIGAAKCGTTSLFGLMADHPEIYTPYRKELWFFNNEIAGQVESYKAHFSGAEANQVVGEATPGYLPNVSPTIENIQKVYEASPRFLVILRDPVRRFWSHYLHNRAHGWETRSFEEVIDDGASTGTPAFPNSPIHNVFRVGEYGQQLERWFGAFSQSQFKIIFLEDLAEDTSGTLCKVFRFLGVTKTVEPVRLERRQNSAWSPRSEFVHDVVNPFVTRIVKKIFGEKAGYTVHKRVKEMNKQPIEKPRMPEWGRDVLAGYYEEDVRRLERLLDQPLPSEWTVRT